MVALHRKVLPFLLVFALSSAAMAEVQSKMHIILISVDGLRPDSLTKIKAPNFDYFIKSGTYFRKARTIDLSETLPSHTSMITGVSEHKHKVTWNDYKFWRKLEVPTCFEIAKKAGLSTAMFVGKDKLRHLNRPGSLNHFELTGDALRTVAAFSKYVKNSGLPNLSLLHLRDPDEEGHDEGWMSPAYLEAVQKVDEALGYLVHVLRVSNLEDSTTIILTGDHGGFGFGHSDDIGVNKKIIWVIKGPNIAPNVSVWSDVFTYDSAATILDLFGLAIPNNFDGRPLPVKQSTVPSKVLQEPVHR